MKLWILGTEKGRSSAFLSRTRPPSWSFNGYHHIGKQEDWDESMILDDEQEAAFKTKKIPPGKFAVYHLVKRRAAVLNPLARKLRE